MQILRERGSPPGVGTLMYVGDDGDGLGADESGTVRLDLFDIIAGAAAVHYALLDKGSSVKRACVGVAGLWVAARGFALVTR